MVTDSRLGPSSPYEVHFVDWLGKLLSVRIFSSLYLGCQGSEPRVNTVFGVISRNVMSRT